MARTPNRTGEKWTQHGPLFPSPLSFQVIRSALDRDITAGSKLRMWAHEVTWSTGQIGSVFEKTIQDGCYIPLK